MDKEVQKQRRSAKMNRDRNHVVLAMVRTNKGTQVHGKSTGAERRQARMNMRGYEMNNYSYEDDYEDDWDDYEDQYPR